MFHSISNDSLFSDDSPFEDIAAGNGFKFDPIDGTFVRIDFDHVLEQEDIFSIELNEQGRNDCHILIYVMTVLAVLILVLIYISSSITTTNK